ncbi:MAG: TMEM175 family protein [Candidatus Limnocylindrales bacterium]
MALAARERLVLFSDAVFAIAITLLAIDLRLPVVAGGYDDASLVAAVVALGPALLAYALSFFVIAMFWLGHLRTLRVVVRIDSIFIGLNLVFLAFVAIVPFPTSVVAMDGNLASATILYALFGASLAVLSMLLWVYATRIGHLASERLTPEIARRVTYRTTIVPALFLVSIPVALVNTTLARAIWIVAAPAQAFVSRRLHLDANLGLDGPAPPASL